MSEEINYANPGGTTTSADQPDIHAVLHPKDKVGIALVGLGTYSTEQLGPALLETHYCRLAGIVTGTPAKIPEWKSKYALPDNSIYDYHNFDEISANADIDVVYVVLPNALHAEFVIRAAKAGKHVICEKPMGLSVKECDEMIKACKEANKLLSIGYRLHFDPYHKEIIRHAEQKTYGDLNYLRAQHGSKDTKGWRLEKQLAGGGPLMDLGIYCIQAGCYITGKSPIAVKVTEHITNGDGVDAIENHITWEMEFDEAPTMIGEASYTTEFNMIHGKAEHGWFELSPAFSYRGLTGKTATGFIHFSAVNQQALQMDDFALSILQNKPVTVPGEMGRRDLKIIEAIYASMKTGNRVEITW